MWTKLCRALSQGIQTKYNTGLIQCFSGSTLYTGRGTECQTIVSLYYVAIHDPLLACPGHKQMDWLTYIIQ